MAKDSKTIPSLSIPGHIPNASDGLTRYLSKIRKFPFLEAEEEFMLAKRWKEHQDPQAAEKLVSSHLRLVAKIASGYKGYGLPLGDLIAEGSVGLMHALRKYDPDKGFRLSTYAMWWIRASIQEYILRSWSLVKIGTTAAQKKLFFNLRRLKAEARDADQNEMSSQIIRDISEKLNVSEKEVIEMNKRMSGQDQSLNASIKALGTEEWQDWLEDEEKHEDTLIERDEYKKRNQLLEKAMRTSLNAREQLIISQRRLKDDPKTLEKLSQELGISRERVRQIEIRAFEKLQKVVKSYALQRRLIE